MPRMLFLLFLGLPVVHSVVVVVFVVVGFQPFPPTPLCSVPLPLHIYAGMHVHSLSPDASGEIFFNGNREPNSSVGRLHERSARDCIRGVSYMSGGDRQVRERRVRQVLMCGRRRGEPSARVVCRRQARQRVERVNEHRPGASLGGGGEERGCPDTTCGAAATTSGTHVQESSGFYPATRPLTPTPPPITLTHTLTHSHYDLPLLARRQLSPNGSSWCDASTKQARVCAQACVCVFKT